MIWTLLAVGFWEPFFFCLGFLASRLDRFCSLFATTASLQVSGGNYAAGARRCNRQIKPGPSTSLLGRRRRQGERLSRQRLSSGLGRFFGAPQGVLGRPDGRQLLVAIVSMA